MHIADCIELYLAHDVHGAFTKQLEQTQESQLSAGGPGSGRHPEFGNFNRTSTTMSDKDDDTYFKSKNGNSLVRVNLNTSGKTRVFETNYGRGSGKEQQVHQSYKGEHKDFLSDRYGIK